MSNIFGIYHAEIIENYPFILSTRHRHYSSFHSEHRQIAVLREINPNPRLEILSQLV
jgi:hypothetical protein